MKIWIFIFMLVLAAGLASGLARDLFSKERAKLKGIVTGIDGGNAIPKWLPPTSPRFKVRLADGRLVDVATTRPVDVPIGSTIAVTEWVAPWGQLWYSERD